MIIKNFKKLAKNDLRKKALEIAESAYEAIEIEKTVKRKICFDGQDLSFGSAQDIKFDLNNFKRIFIVGIGKGSAQASATLAKILGPKLNGGIALDIKNSKFKIQNSKFKIFEGTHPLPSLQNFRATQKIIKLAESLTKNDLLITFICGGGSALFCDSKEELKYSQDIFKILTQAGADIAELNTVRKHISPVKGGGLAKMAYPAAVVSLIVSDVCGNDLSNVASGPTVYDKTTNQDVEKIFKKYKVYPVVNAKHSTIGVDFKNIRLHENPHNKKYFKKVKNILFVCNQDAVMAMMEKAKTLGFGPKIFSLTLEGEAREALLPMMAIVKSNEAILAAGETTVNLKKPVFAPAFAKASAGKKAAAGKGGRNQEAVLGALNNMRQKMSESAPERMLKNIIIMSFSSDAHDNTEAAGAIGDYLTLQKAKKLKLDLDNFLADHDSFHFFQKVGDLIFAGQKCFNVADFMIVLKK